MKSFLSTIWHCNLTVPWPTLSHCWRDSFTNPMLICTYYWRSLGALYNKVASQKLAEHLLGIWTGILPNLSVNSYPARPFSLVFNIYGPLDYSPLVFNVYSCFLSWFAVFQSFAFLIFLHFLPPGWLIFKWFYFSICVVLSI